MERLPGEAQWNNKGPYRRKAGKSKLAVEDVMMGVTSWSDVKKGPWAK